MSLTWNGLRKVLQQTPGWVRRLCPFLCHSCHQRCGCGVGSTLEGRETGPPGPGWEAGAGRVRGQASGAGEGRTVAGTSRREWGEGSRGRGAVPTGRGGGPHKGRGFASRPPPKPRINVPLRGPVLRGSPPRPPGTGEPAAPGSPQTRPCVKCN